MFALAGVIMDVMDTLVVRFHFNGVFINFGNSVHYVGGRRAMSYIDRDKVSLLEIIGHLRDHLAVDDATMLHWLFPWKTMSDGLRVLMDDNAWLQMSDATVEGGVADIYVEQTTVGESNGDQESAHNDHQMTILPDSREDIGIQAKKLQEFYRSPSKKKSGSKEKKKTASEEEKKGKEKVSDENCSSDSDYLPGYDSSSDADEEEGKIHMKFKDFKKKLKRGHIASLDDVILEGSTAMPAGFEDVMDEGNDTPYEDSSDEEYESMDEFDSDGHLVSKENNCVRFKKTSGTPTLLWA
jgi:alpha-galactosidase